MGEISDAIETALKQVRGNIRAMNGSLPSGTNASRLQILDVVGSALSKYMYRISLGERLRLFAPPAGSFPANKNVFLIIIWRCVSPGVVCTFSDLVKELSIARDVSIKDSKSSCRT